jgi:tRNA threonylcarbamoyladenosine biosynthesis protein TsaB
MMRLVFDTSTASVSLGVWCDEGWLETVDRAEVEKQQSKVLLQMIQDLFRPLGIEMREITEIAVGEGPGSFTGLRMGMTVAKVWAYAHKTEVLTFSSAQLLAKTKLKEPEIHFPKVKYLEEKDYRRLLNLNELVPIYENDHFA